MCLRNAGLAFWNRNADLALLQRNTGLNLTFCICRIDCVYRVFDLLSTSATPSSISIPVESRRLLRISGNLKLWSLERREMVKLIFTIITSVSRHIGSAGLLRDVDAGCVGSMGGFYNLTGSTAACNISNNACYF